MLVGMGRKAIDRVDVRADGDVLAEEVHVLGAIDDPPRERPRGGIADEDDSRFLPPEIVPQMMTHPTARAHARARHDDGAAADSVYGHRLGRLAGKMQAGEAEWVMTVVKEPRERGIKSFRVTLEDFGCGDRHRRIEKRLQGRRQSIHGNALTQEEQNLLRPFKRKSGNDHITTPRKGGCDCHIEFFDRVRKRAMAPVAIGRFHDDGLGPSRRRWSAEQRPSRISNVARIEDAPSADLLVGFDQDAGGPKNVSGIKERRAKA
ncbi:MAG TPA: hypothetical protein VGU20_09055 [Stellaceae bacterium]|nr:hypothetical protein [Stellaceae bacterium]